MLLPRRLHFQIQHDVTETPVLPRRGSVVASGWPIVCAICLFFNSSFDFGQSDGSLYSVRPPQSDSCAANAAVAGFSRHREPRYRINRGVRT